MARYPNSFFDWPIAPAWAPHASTEEPGVKYFIDFSVKMFGGAATAEQHARLAQAVPACGGAQPAPSTILYRMDAENNLRHEMAGIGFSKRACVCLNMVSFRAGCIGIHSVETPA